ncbi:MAG: hypothetical protein HY716_01785 [Planctomycetes bacterium]|nr:hypothetical protein [Planctomycetota bacterium]
MLEYELPNVVRMATRLFRHMNFIDKYLGAGNKKNCTQDLKDIVLHDLPNLELSLGHFYSCTHGAKSLGVDKELLYKTIDEADVERAGVVTHKALKARGK